MRYALLVFYCALSALAIQAMADAPAASSPTTQEAPKLTEREASILLQLANAEANIKTINKALVNTGYRVGLAYEQKENAEKGNELMDRKGGGPVPWDQFYGKTAMGFYYHSSEEIQVRNAGHGLASGELQYNGSRLTTVKRPPEFDFIYRANSQQTARAQDQIASLLQDQAALLARRQKHETDQSSLWAILSWERAKDREIKFRPLYRFALVPAGARADLLRGPVLFLRTTDKAISNALDTVNSDQASSFTDLRQRTKDAYNALQATMADAVYAKDVTPDDRTQADTMKSLCKETAEVCIVIDDNYRLAMDSDRAKEDNSKLQYRAELQASLAKFSEIVADLDSHISAAADAWSIKPNFGTKSPDKVPAFAALRPTSNVMPSASLPPTSPLPLPVTPSPVEGSRPARHNTAPTGFEALFDGQTMDGWNGRQGDINPEVVHAMSPDKLKENQDKWNADRDKHWHVDVEKGELVSDGHGVFLATEKDYHNFEMWVDWLMVSHNGDSGIYLRGYPQVQIWDPDNPAVQIHGAAKGSGALWNDYLNNPGKWPLVKADNPVGQWNTFHIKMVGDRVWVWFNDKLTVDGSVLDNYFHLKDHGHIIDKGPIELQTHGSEIRFRNIYVRELNIEPGELAPDPAK